jgi:hypothetical protein
MCASIYGMQSIARRVAVQLALIVIAFSIVTIAANSQQLESQRPTATDAEVCIPSAEEALNRAVEFHNRIAVDMLVSHSHYDDRVSARFTKVEYLDRLGTY